MRVLLAGASGAIGSEILTLLKAQGVWVRTLSRDAARAERLRGLADDVVVADATRDDVRAVARGVDVVVSALGASVGFGLRERRSYRGVDLEANTNILESAVTHGARRFVYVGVHSGPGYSSTGYVRAHEAFGGRLAQTGLGWTVVRPTGVFSALTPLVDLARRGRMALIGDGHARTNPVHPVDVAEACVRSLDEGPPEISVGGPEVLTRRAIAEAAFTAVGLPPRFFEVPPAVARANGALIGLVHPRLGELIQFLTAVATSEAVGPPIGTRTLLDYFRRHASAPPALPGSAA